MDAKATILGTKHLSWLCLRDLDFLYVESLVSSALRLLFSFAAIAIFAVKLSYSYRGESAFLGGKILRDIALHHS